MNRNAQIEILQAGRVFDLLVIGGGATGAGIALDAACRGLKVALLEKNDFSEGTSSRSTKLVHGGVRYLEMAVKKLDRVQYNLVRDGLRERGLLLRNARHLSNRLALVTPLYRWIDVPYVFSGLKLYDILAGRQNIGHSRLLSRKEALQRFPGLKAKGLKAGVLYYDGQFHDARMALSLAMTAARQGAVVANHLAVTGVVKDQGKLCAVEVKDSLSGTFWRIRGLGVINAAGPFIDRIRQLDEPASVPMLKVSSGIHLVLDKRFAPPDTGLMIPATEDGRVLFILPWEGHALVGTTDEPAELSEHPHATDLEIDYLLRHVGRYFNLTVGRHDIKSVWSGLRPLVADPKAVDTARLARDHVLVESPSGLLTIAGGKWTTYRKMAQDTVDHAIRMFALSAPQPECRTEHLAIVGSTDFDEKGAQRLMSDFGCEAEIAEYLHRNYGDQADQIATASKEQGFARLVPEHPVLEAEVAYAARCEFAVRAIDVLARRTPLALLDLNAALAALPRVIELLTAELGWTPQRRDEERILGLQRLKQAL